MVLIGSDLPSISRATTRKETSNWSPQRGAVCAFGPSLPSGHHSESAAPPFTDYDWYKVLVTHQYRTLRAGRGYYFEVHHAMHKVGKNPDGSGDMVVKLHSTASGCNYSLHPPSVPPTTTGRISSTAQKRPSSMEGLKAKPGSLTSHALMAIVLARARMASTRIYPRSSSIRTFAFAPSPGRQIYPSQSIPHLLKPLPPSRHTQALCGLVWVACYHARTAILLSNQLHADGAGGVRHQQVCQYQGGERPRRWRMGRDVPCPDGAIYQVGDNHNSCNSLACIGGISGVCGKYNPGGSNVSHVCTAVAARHAAPPPTAEELAALAALQQPPTSLWGAEDLAEPQPLPMVPQDPAARCVVHPSSGALKALLQMTISTLAVSAVQKSS